MRLLKFESAWCGPCKKMKPVVQQIAQAHNLEVVEIDIDEAENKDWVEAYEVKGVPTLILEDEQGEIRSRLVGAKPRGQAERALGLA